jgi:CYTH domain-containing protein
VSIHDGLIAAYKDRKVRVRTSGKAATIAIKGPRTRALRVRSLSMESRFRMPSGRFRPFVVTTLWRSSAFLLRTATAVCHVDVYGGLLESFVIAEIELKQETEELALRVGSVGR